MRWNHRNECFKKKSSLLIYDDNLTRLTDVPVKYASVGSISYDIEQPAMNDICSDEAYIYTCNTLNGDSYINKCRKEDQSVKMQSVAQMYIRKIVCADGKIYAFGTKKVEHAFRSYLLIFDEELQLTDQIDISECGSSHYKAIVRDGNLFMGSCIVSGLSGRFSLYAG